MLDNEQRPWRIDITDESQVVRWAHTFGVTRERLRHAVFAVGTLVGHLRAFLITEPQFAY